MANDNLLGKSHKQYVQDQIKVRQEILGKDIRDSKELSWMNGKTSWIRLASSIDIKNTTTKQKIVVGEKETERTVNNGDRSVTTTTTEEISQEQDVIDTVNGTPVGEERLKRLDLNKSYMGSVLANNLVLHGGVEKHSFNPDEMSKRYGIAEVHSNTVQTFQAYNSKNGDFGLVAMPGLQSVDIKSKSMGSLREATVSLRINDPEQLELLETLYLRIGYSLFLEWGNSSYYSYDSSGNPILTNGIGADPGLLFQFLDPSDKLKNCPTTIVQEIEKAREISNGNYDALFGRVKNFSWEFNPQGFYTATVEIISWGDIIESLNIDGFYPEVYISKLKEKEEETETQTPSVEKKDESLLNTFIYESTLPTFVQTETLYVQTGEGIPASTTVTKTNYSPTRNTLKGETTTQTKAQSITSQNISLSPEQLSQAGDYSDALKYGRSGSFSEGKIIQGTAIFGEDKAYSYVRFGDLLDFIKARLLIYPNSVCGTPIIDINTDPKANYCYTPGVNVSADPSKVMVNVDIPTTLSNLETYSTLLGRDFNQSPSGNLKKYNSIKRGIFNSGKSSTFRDKDINLEKFTSDVILSEGKQIKNVLVGLIMNIYFEKEFLYQQVDQLRDKKTGKLQLYKFIKSLLDEANSALGGVNKLDLRVVDDSILTIYDQVPLYNWKKPFPQPQPFNIFGLQSTPTVAGNKPKRDGSFVTNFGLKTELTNEFATITSIGAQANGSVVGEDSTFLSKWNFGLVDRFYAEKLDSTQKQNPDLTPEQKEEEEFKALNKKMLDLWADYSLQTTDITSIDQTLFLLGAKVNSGYVFPSFRTKSISSYVKLQKDYLKILIKRKSRLENIKSNQIGMLPINLNLEMDGISGIRIYDQIRVNTRFLPSYYPKFLMFIIKGISHSFNGNRWITKIDTIAQPKVQFDTSPDYESDIKEVDVKDIIDDTTNDQIDGLVDVTRTLNRSAQKSIIEAYGWPTEVQEIDNKFYAKRSSIDSGGRNVYSRDSNYVKDNAETLSYDFGNGNSYTVRNVHKDLIPIIEKVFDRIKAKDLYDGISNVGCSIYVRDVTGKKNTGILSGHSFGLAIDVNAGFYPYGNKGYELYKADLAAKKKTALVVQEFTFSTGLNWGGYYSGTKDAHHFSISEINGKKVQPF